MADVQNIARYEYIQELQNKIRTLQEKHALLEKKYAQKVVQCDLITETQTSLRKQLIEAQKDMADLKKDYKTLKYKASQDQERIQSYEREVVLNQGLIGAQQTEVETLTKKLEHSAQCGSCLDLQSEYKSVVQLFNALKLENENLRSRSREVMEQFNSLNEISVQRDNFVKDLTSEYEAKHLELQKSITKFEHEKKRYNDEKKRIRQKVESMKDAMKRFEQSHQPLNETIQILTQENRSLHDRLERREGETKGLQNLVDEFRQKLQINASDPRDTPKADGA